MSAEDRDKALARLGRETHAAVRSACVQLLADAELRVQERDLRIEELESQIAEKDARIADLEGERGDYQRLTRDLVAVGAQSNRQVRQARRRIKELEKLAGITRRPPSGS